MRPPACRSATSLICSRDPGRSRPRPGRAGRARRRGARRSRPRRRSSAARNASSRGIQFASISARTCRPARVRRHRHVDHVGAHAAPRRCTGYSGCWKMLAISTRSSPAMMSSVPLPWWTSKSMIATRSRPRTSSAWRAATATLLKKQKPIACVARRVVAGRAHRAEGVRDARRRCTASVAATAAPAARSTALPGAGRGDGVGVERARPAVGGDALEHVAQLGDVAGCCARSSRSSSARPAAPRADRARRRGRWRAGGRRSRRAAAGTRDGPRPCRGRGSRGGCRRPWSSVVRVERLTRFSSKVAGMSRTSCRPADRARSTRLARSSSASGRRSRTASPACSPAATC